MDKMTVFLATDGLIFLQALLALFLGGALGWERSASGKPAGLRTHMLVCLAAFLFVRLGVLLIEQAGDEVNPTILRGDPTRILEAIVTGISFLGAGVIFRDPDQHRAVGLTTAASLLITAPVGVAIALDRYGLAIGITILVLIVLHVLTPLKPHDQGP